MQNSLVTLGSWSNLRQRSGLRDPSRSATRRFVKDCQQIQERRRRKLQDISGGAPLVSIWRASFLAKCFATLCRRFNALCMGSSIFRGCGAARCCAPSTVWLQEVRPSHVHLLFVPRAGDDDLTGRAGHCGHPRRAARRPLCQRLESVASRQGVELFYKARLHRASSSWVKAGACQTFAFIDCAQR